MAMMMQSSNAQNRSLGDWYNMIKLGQIKLPRFQRMEAWDRNRILSFMNTIINNLPVGVTLILQVGDKERFHSRFISSAEPEAAERPMEHLLDGQQRLTAFWRVMNNNFEWENYFLYLPDHEQYYDSPWNEQPILYCRTRYLKNDKKYPQWPDKPSKCLLRGSIPMELFNPEYGESLTRKWIDEATEQFKPKNREDPNYHEEMDQFYRLRSQLENKITSIRESLKHFNLPYLSLPVTTRKDVSLQVFINMNTNSKPLSLYDIIVAEVENVKGRSLHDMQSELDAENPQIKKYFPLSNLILTTSALLQNKLPNNRGMIEMDKKELINNWDILCTCLSKMVEFLQMNKIYDRQRLPTNAVLSVIAACYSHIPETGDKRGADEILLKKYLWSSFFSDRYENAAASRAFADYQILQKILRDIPKVDGTPYSESDVPVLYRIDFSLADENELASVGWPKQENIRGRAILSVASYLGAIDFADGQPLTADNAERREYHHLFPDALLKEASIDSFKALNCALITWKTNRIIGRSDPLTYIKERSVWTNEEVVKIRLHSHLIPIE